MAFEREVDGTDPLRSRAAAPLREVRYDARSGRLATGTLACPECDAPVALGERRLSPDHPLGCPYCGHAAALRDFLSLAEPTRPARVEVRVVARERAVRA
jgi:DNA-directed RNA polymerase subunit RPC12/RpoP